MTKRWMAILPLLLGFFAAACATTGLEDADGLRDVLVSDSATISVLLGYRCTNSAWPASPAELRRYAAAQDEPVFLEVSERSWEILSQCEFRSTPEGSLQIEGRFEAGEAPFPNSKRPVELNISVESDSCDLFEGEDS